MSQHATIKGTVESYLLGPKGHIEGLLLSDDRQLSIPSHLRKQLSDIASVGSAVTVEVKPGQESDYGQSFKLFKWLNGQSDRRGARRLHGPVSSWLVNSEGRPKGFILADGTQVHLPKSLRKEVIPRLRLGGEVGVQGICAQSRFGKVLTAKRVYLDGLTLQARR
jgi:hypothetical protein